MPNHILPSENSLLASLPDAVKADLYPKLKLTELISNQVVEHPHQSINSIFFPVNSVIGLISELVEGDVAQVATIGCMEYTGLSATFGAKTAVFRSEVILSGYAFGLKRKDFISWLDKSQEFRQLFLIANYKLMQQTVYRAACNRHHSIHQQLCLLLLQCFDRAKTEKLNMTHEHIANLLGVRREGISEAAHKLQSHKAIDYKRGHIIILNRGILEDMCCECYLGVNSAVT